VRYANSPGFLPESGNYPGQFANFVGLGSETGTNRPKFAHEDDRRRANPLPSLPSAARRLKRYADDDPGAPARRATPDATAASATAPATASVTPRLKTLGTM
jgi:hypothetical protein